MEEKDRLFELGGLLEAPQLCQSLFTHPIGARIHLHPIMINYQRERHLNFRGFHEERKDMILGF